MKRLSNFIYFTFFGILLCISLNSCYGSLGYASNNSDEVYNTNKYEMINPDPNGNIDFRIVFEYGTPFYYHDFINYYEYKGWYYYPFWYNDMWYLRPYRRPFALGYYPPYRNWRPLSRNFGWEPGNYGYYKPYNGNFGIPRKPYNNYNYNKNRNFGNFQRNSNINENRGFSNFNKNNRNFGNRNSMQKLPKININNNSGHFGFGRR